MTAHCATIDEYINAFPPGVQVILEQVRRTIRDAAPATGEAISYGMPTMTLDGRDLLHFAAWKRHIALYPLPAVDDAIAQELAPYRAAKSTARFPLSKPIPYDLIARLVVLLVTQRRGTYAQQGDAKRDAALNRLTRLSEELGLYDRE